MRLASPGLLRQAAMTLVAAFLGGCAEDGASDAGFRVETVGGIEHSVAQDHPGLGEQGLELLWRAPDEAAVLQGTEWVNPSAIALNEDYIAVLDPQMPRVHLFTPDGERIRSFGRRGEGPGELSQPVSIGVHGDSVLVAGMLASPALQWFGSDGSYLGSAGSPDDGLSGGAHLLPGVGIVRPVVNPQTGEGWEYMELTGERHPLELPADHPMQPHVADGGEGCWRRGAAGPHLIELDCAFPLLRVIDPSGRVVREHRIDRPPRRTPDRVIERAVEQMEQTMRASSQGLPQELIGQIIGQRIEHTRAQYVWTPVMRSVLGSLSGHRIVLVEQIPYALGDEPATLHVLDSDGRYLVRHAFNHRIGAVAASDTRLVVMMEDEETGLRHMAAYRLP